MIERVLKELARVARARLAESQDRRSRVSKDALEPRPPRGERQRPQIFVAIAQDVERDERDAAGGRPAVRFGQVDAVLQPLKACGLAVVVERDDLAVEHDGALSFFA